MKITKKKVQIKMPCFEEPTKMLSQISGEDLRNAFNSICIWLKIEQKCQILKKKHLKLYANNLILSRNDP